MTVIEQKSQFGVNYDIGYDGFTSRQKDFISAGINWFERWEAIPGVPPVSHVFKIVGEDLTIEAFGDGVRYGKLSNYLNDHTCALLVRKPLGWTLGMGFRMHEEAKRHFIEKIKDKLDGMVSEDTIVVSGSDSETGSDIEDLS